MPLGTYVHTSVYSHTTCQVNDLYESLSLSPISTLKQVTNFPECALGVFVEINSKRVNCVIKPPHYSGGQRCLRTREEVGSLCSAVLASACRIPLCCEPQRLGAPGW